MVIQWPLLWPVFMPLFFFTLAWRKTQTKQKKEADESTIF